MDLVATKMHRMQARIEELEAWQSRARLDMERMERAIVALSDMRSAASSLSLPQQYAHAMLNLLVEACDTLNCACGLFSPTFVERAERLVRAAGGETQLDRHERDMSAAE